MSRSARIAVSRIDDDDGDDYDVDDGDHDDHDDDGLVAAPSRIRAVNSSHDIVGVDAGVGVVADAGASVRVVADAGASVGASSGIGDIGAAIAGTATMHTESRQLQLTSFVEPGSGQVATPYVRDEVAAPEAVGSCRGLSREGVGGGNHKFHISVHM